MSYELVVKQSAADVAREAAEVLIQLAVSAIAERGRFRLALSGGSTPGVLYSLLASKPYRSQLPWPQVVIYWGDERHLPAGHPGRNDTEVLPLFLRAGAPAANLHPIPYVPDDPDAAAEQYEALLRSQSRPHEPLLDVVLLGLGNDGHTASLFPGSPALDETERLVVANFARYEDRHPLRVSLTLSAIDACGLALFLVTGASKRTILQRVLGSPEAPPLPAQRVRPARGQVLWLVDQEAFPL